MTTTTVTYTPWGWTRDIEELAEGVWRVSTPSHGGLKLSRERWNELPAAIRDTMLTATFAEEDCEEPIVRLLLCLGDARDREMALKVAGYFDRYAPALPYLRDRSPHYHVVAHLGGCATDPIGRFDTTEEAEAFADTGGWEAVSCDGAPALPRKGGEAMTATTRPRPRSLPSTTTKLQTEMGNLYVTVSVDEDGEPFEVFGWLGKGGSFQHGVTELACRLISLHLRRGTPLEEVIDQCRGIQEMQPFFNQMPDGTSVAILGLGDGIAHILKAHLKAREERETEQAVEAKAA